MLSGKDGHASSGPTGGLSPGLCPDLPVLEAGSQLYQEQVAACLAPAVRVLDLGCGRGGVLEWEDISELELYAGEDKRCW